MNRTRTTLAVIVVLPRISGPNNEVDGPVRPIKWQEQCVRAAGFQIIKRVQSLFIGALVAVPLLAFAQSDRSITRDQVRAELIELQRAGYDPSSDETQYPKNIEAALRRVHAMSLERASSHGRLVSGGSRSGSGSTSSNAPGVESLYARP